MEIFAGGAWRTITAGEVYLSGAWRTLAYGESYNTAAWKRVATFVQPLTVACSPSPVDGAVYPSRAITLTVTTPATTASPTGGLGPFTYAWSLISSALGTPTADTPASATTTFTQTLAHDTSNTAVFRVTVTDSLGTVSTADITATFENITTGLA